jgi:quercetin dioxygenase-like cupin family protein
MKKYKLEDFKMGWFIGNFEPNILKTETFEAGLLFRKKGLYESPHYHAIATEYNLIVSGSMTLNGEDLKTGDIFIVEPNEIVYPTFHEDTYLMCIKTPSIPTDKHIV